MDASGENLDPERVWAVLMRNEKPGGHSGGTGGDRRPRHGDLGSGREDRRGAPAPAAGEERFGAGEPDPTVAVYAAGGYYPPGQGRGRAGGELERYLGLGYTTREDQGGRRGDGRRPAADRVALGLLDGDGSRLAVDANGRFDLTTAIEFGAAIESYGLRWYEEAGDPLDYRLNARLAASYPHHCLATGENLFSVRMPRNLVRFGGVRPGLDLLQMDPALSYGLTEYLRTLAAIEAEGFSRRSVVPHGGHQFDLAIAAGLGLGGNESYPGVFQPFGGFADRIAVEDGEVGLPEVPGVGFEAKADLFKVMEAI